ncbi:putative integral membrane protein (dedA homolog) [hydrothermal vent metagenome]|uniref:Putative integral membrane protein (DedA homolog) n=1 Tax=hydrothermal vent metagenome TaxID=652676 RepID=A0A1W1CCH1_9ZZZZ
MLQEIAAFLVDKIGDMGYWGIFLLMFLESTFFPFPSEIIMIPAGYLAYKGDMNVYLVVIIGIAGSVGGALFNYYLAMHFGRKFLLKYGKYVFVKEKTLEKLEIFFRKHGEVSTFNGRLIPGIRQLISLPAGLAKMNIVKFSLYSALGAGIWVVVLVFLGYILGSNEALISEYLHTATLIALVSVVLITIFYMIRNKRKKEILGED